MSRFIPQYGPYIKLKYIWSVIKQIYSGWIGSGKACELVEQELCKITNNKYCVSTTSGTTALVMAIKSLNIPKYKKILLPAYTFIAPHNAAKFLGYDIELVDIDKETLCMHRLKLSEKIKELGSDKVGAVIYVTHNGCYNYLGNIKGICQNYNIPLIEDSSQSLGGKYGFIGDLSIVSFSVPKICTSGQGGAVLTQNKNLYNELKKIQDQGGNWRETKIHQFLGVNFKFNDILAAYLLPQLKNLKQLIKRRDNVFKEYRRYINLIDYGYDSTWMAIYQTKYAKEIIMALKKQNIQAVQYYKPINHNPPYKDDNIYPNAEQIYNTCVYLPSSLTLKKRDIKKICTIINEIESPFCIEAPIL